ncbi:hypothetical protein RIB2604_01701390 [Aspergillus luchuensis]|uniref:Uncharacterized protein n=1 Tax=Aspergillus kawachii TaxID=1069201 RepID=A0A146FBV6_ASPKA|nr:hypothetical protein RIB2604_01701390 [Aspergillus luchuensis]
MSFNISGPAEATRVSYEYTSTPYQPWHVPVSWADGPIKSHGDSAPPVSAGGFGSPQRFFRAGRNDKV